MRTIPSYVCRAWILTGEYRAVPGIKNHKKNRRNYYRILHVQADAPQAIIKTSYRTLMQKLKQHPDLGGDEWNASVLNEAYSVLSNPDKRSSYDREYLKGKTGHGLRSRTTSTEPPPPDKGQWKQPPKRQPRNNSICPFCGTPKPVRLRYGGSTDCSRCSSPLQTVVQLRSATTARRAVQRTPHQAPLAFFTGVNDQSGNPGVISDLSPRGLKFMADKQVQEGTVVKITSGILSATGQVVYCRPKFLGRQFIIGVEFITLRFHRSTGTFISESA